MSMTRILKRLSLLSGSLALLVAVSFASSGHTYAAPTSQYDPFQAICSAAGNPKSNPACSANGSDPITGKTGILYKTSRIIALVAGLGAVVMIMIGGFMYMTANGDAGKASAAKSTITAAVIGLMVIILSEALVAFSINLVKK